MDEQELSQLRVPAAIENDRPSEIVSQPPRDVPLRRQIERQLVDVAFVALWVALGWLLKLLKIDPNAYLLLGVPLTAGFQVVVARRPIRALWVREAPRLRVDRTWLLMTGALSALPLYELSQGYRHCWVIIGWYLCAIAGAPAAAYAIQNWDRRALRALPVALGMLVFVSALMALIAVDLRGMTVLSGSTIVQAARWTLLNLPVCFMLEEVTFRGALDSYLWRPDEKQATGSTIELSFLWGLWHLPVAPMAGTLFLLGLRLGCWHLVAGIPLSLSWRAGGNLLVPAAAHAALDGVRNALLLIK
jgi:Type II CAAX prenyl endopeptidase Rce1-like